MRYLYHIPHFVLSTLVNSVLTMSVAILGLPMVVLGLLFGTDDYPETAKQFTKSNGTWILRRLKRPFLFWDNMFDGALGDSSGDWNRITTDRYGLPSTSFLAMWEWLAVRNPANYFGRIIMGIDAKNYDYELLGGVQEVSERKHGWQFILATHKITGKFYYCLRFSYAWWFNHERVFYGVYGHKLQMAHANLTVESNIRDRFIGTVSRLNPYKYIQTK